MSQEEGQEKFNLSKKVLLHSQVRGSRQMACNWYLLTETEVAGFRPEGLFNLREQRMHLLHECWEL